MKSLIFLIFYLAVSNAAPRIGDSSNISKPSPTSHPFSVISPSNKKNIPTTEKSIIENATLISFDDAVTALYISVNQTDSIQDEDEDVVVQSLDDIDVIKSKPKETTSTTKKPMMAKPLSNFNGAVAKTVAHYSPPGLGPKSTMPKKDTTVNKAALKIEADTSSIEESEDNDEEQEKEQEEGEKKDKANAKFQLGLPIKTSKVGAT